MARNERPIRYGTHGPVARAAEAGPKEKKREGDMTTLAKWRCHKVVRAGKILEIGRPFPAADSAVRLMVQGLHGPVEQEVPDDFFARTPPKVGDYFVLYDDGYMSHSPPEPFEGGYTRIEEDP